MNIPGQAVKHSVIGIAAFALIIIPLPAAAADDVSKLNIERMKSLVEVSGTLGLLENRFSEAKRQNVLAFNLQKMVVIKSGDCITRVVELSQKADLSQGTQRDEFKKFFLKNGALLRRILDFNRSRADDVLEEKSSDTNSLFSSTEWQQVQYLMSLTSYWLGWNNYYGAILYTEHTTARTELLEEAVSGFTHASLNFQEQSIVSRSILGRALCFTELKRYDKAQQDLQTVMTRVSCEDSLYAQAGYERALVSYLSGKKDRALQQIQELEETVKTKTMPQQIKDKLHSLQTTIALGIAEKKPSAHDSGTRESYLETVRNLKRIADADESQAGVLYQYVLEHAATLANSPDAELGSMGTMAIADWYFERKQYDRAIERYRRLYSAPDALIKRHLDDVCFRLAYALAQREQWQEALACLETLFAKFPKASFGGKAACLYYVVAVRAYKANPAEAAYSRYIKAAECYVKNCPDARDKSEAHYQLGLYHQHKNRTQEALQEFALVKSDSPHYGEAQTAEVLSLIEKLQASVEKIETLVRQGQSDEALRLYRETLKQAEGWQKAAVKKNAAADSREAEAQISLLLARLYIHGPVPEPQKALQVLQGFESRYVVTRQQSLLYSTVKKLRLECYLQLHLLNDAEQEMNSISGKGPVDQGTLAFLNECADKYYRQAKDKKAKGDADLAAKAAQTALAVYKKLAGITATNTTSTGLKAAIQMRLAELYVENNQAKQAAALYRKMLEQDPSSADAIYQLGLIYETQGQWQDGFDTWRQFAQGLKQGTPAWFEARYREAWSLVKLGKKTDACEVIAATKIRFQDFGAGEYSRKFMQLNDEVCSSK